MKKKKLIFIILIFILLFYCKNIYAVDDSNEEMNDVYELDELFGYWDNYYNYGNGTGEEYEKAKSEYINTMIELGYMNQDGEWNDTAKQVIEKMENGTVDWNEWYPLLKESAKEELSSRETKMNDKQEIVSDVNSEYTGNNNIKILVIINIIGIICMIVLLIMIINYVSRKKK